MGSSWPAPTTGPVSEVSELPAFFAPWRGLTTPAAQSPGVRSLVRADPVRDPSGPGGRGDKRATQVIPVAHGEREPPLY
jgi:hypothetical protein